MKMFAGALLICASAPAVFANDSIATLGAGGLELVNADAISMEREDLYISTSKVKVAYVFRNQSQKDRTHIVAFPMPLITPEFYLEGDLALADREADNFLNFSVTAEGKAVTPELEMRALAGTIDITDQLKAAGIPLNPLQHKTWLALDALPAEARQKLADLGAVFAEDQVIQARWTLKATYFWRQSFPAKTPVNISHSYEPGTGTWFYDPGMLDDAGILKRFCIDDGTAKALKRSTKDGRSWIFAHEVAYILKTGANWSGPIGDFRLVVDKGDPDAILSLCMDGVKKISKTQFEVRKKDFTPKKDLDILIGTPMDKD